MAYDKYNQQVRRHPPGAIIVTLGSACRYALVAFLMGFACGGVTIMECLAK